jgi:hypothetical protein
MFHISYVRGNFEYYYGDAAPYTDGLSTDEQTTDQQVDLEMRARTAGHDVLWLVLSEPEMWDQRGLTVNWLERHGTVVERADLTRVSVIKYRLGP